MKKFRFKLETLLGVTRRKKEDAERRFAEATRALEEARAAGVGVRFLTCHVEPDSVMFRFPIG